jgi:thiamine biosynthesis lipoprotein
MQELSLHSNEDYWSGQFKAMASPCEILIDTNNEHFANHLLKIAHGEASRIETKYSRYRKDNIVFEINNSCGKPVTVDDETAALLNYAQQCYEISDGLFDISSGVLRCAWRFDGNNNVPSQKQIGALLERIGWNQLIWESPVITLPDNMEIDFGGIGKEYAVDKTTQLLKQETDDSVLINFGGDIFVTGPRKSGKGWVVAIEGTDDNTKAEKVKTNTDSTTVFQLKNGGLATSGDTKRHLIKDGVRYSHILNPKTGWPVKNAPTTITTVAQSCTEAGILSTLAMLHGKNAVKFLDDQQAAYWVQY